MDFNKAAVDWDNERREKRAKIIANEIIKSIQIKEHSHALEFGCGTGLVSFNLIDKFDDITLIDTSPGMIETLNCKLQKLNVKNMIALHTNINTNSSLQGKKYDVIYTSMALHHVIDIRTALVNLYKLLNNNGYLCIIDLIEDDGSFHKLEKDFHGHNGFNQKQLKCLLDELGYRNVVTHVFYNGIKIIEDAEIKYSLFIMVGKKQ